MNLRREPLTFLSLVKRVKSFGTERIEEDIKQLFPTAAIARMDTDSMKGKNNWALSISRFVLA